MRKLLLLLTFCTAYPISYPVSAQFIHQRFLPANGERGELGTAEAFPLVRIDKRTFRLTPGARIYDRENRTIAHGQLPAGADILYSRDSTGDVQRIYILTAQEQARLRSGRR